MAKSFTTCTIYGTRRLFPLPHKTDFHFPSTHLAPSRLNFPRQFPSPFAASRKSSSDPKLPQQPTDSIPESDENEIVSATPSATKGRRKSRKFIASEEAAVKDFIRKRLDDTFNSIRQQNPTNDHTEGEEANISTVKTRRKSKKKMAVDEETPNWPLDGEIGWGIRASEYFEKHAIKNVVDEEGAEVDWEGEIDEAWVQEINCLEWESFAFHPSPLVVLVFERYNNVSVNWKTLKELEKAAQVYWGAKDRLPPRMVKLDMNIEKDLAYALKVRDCPVVLFLRGHRVLYRETEFRNADEFVQMIAHFYYNAKRPGFLNTDDR